MANQILLAVNQRRLSVAPGASVDLAVTAQNLTTLLDQVAVRAEGVDPSWTQVIPAYLPVFAQGQATARVVFQPPRDPAAAVAGIYPLRVCGSSQEYPGHEGDATTELEVQLVGDYRFWLERADAHDHQEAVYHVKVDNAANAPLQLQFKGSDPASALWFKFDPFQLTVPPGGQAAASLTLRAKNASPGERSLPFSLVAQGEYRPKDEAPVAAPAHQVAGQFVQGAPARLTLALLPPEVETPDGATFQVRVGNPGAAPITIQLSGADAQGILEFDFEHVQVSLLPQSEKTVETRVRLKAPPTPGGRTHAAFTVTAQPLDSGASAVTAEATFEQRAPAAAEARHWSMAWLVLLAAAFLVGAIGLLLLAAYAIGFLR